MDIPQNYYKILGVSQTSNSIQIKKAYRNLALRYHPDRVSPLQKDSSEEIFKRITEAYYVLGNPERRKLYDRQHSFDSDQSSVRSSNTRTRAYSFQEYDFQDFAKNEWKKYSNERFEFKVVDWDRLLDFGVKGKMSASAILILYFLIPHQIYSALYVGKQFQFMFSYSLLFHFYAIEIAAFVFIVLPYQKDEFFQPLILLGAWFTLLLPAVFVLLHLIF